jgi:predicted nucleic acid-binding protein
MICDSTFFVALDRERRRRQEGPAHSFLRAHAAEEVAMSVITRGELARGFLRRTD